MKRLFALITLGLFGAAFAQGMTTFTVKIENVSSESTLTTPDGAVAVPLSPGVWLTTSETSPLFTVGEADRSQGLEAIAEDGDPTALGDYLAGEMMAGHSGVFNTPVGASEPGPLLPGGVYEFSFEAGPEDRLHFATMFVQSNDLFYAPLETGIALFDDMGNSVSGEVSVPLWDAGTEVNETPGVGEHQAPRQMGLNSGDDEMGVVTLVEGDNAPDTMGPVLKVTIAHNQ